ncbi:MAG TPA: hypothetical protein VJK51_03715 [Candidatus Nanoarchaeia archaeon]|nr:hypothetical protein [Candidatus Nanoarchaeia archaeon]
MTNTQKFKIIEIAGRSHNPLRRGIDCCRTLYTLGFVHKGYESDIGISVFTHLGAVPKKERKFYVYYDSAVGGEDRGNFTLVERVNNRNICIDEGNASIPERGYVRLRGSREIGVIRDDKKTIREEQLILLEEQNTYTKAVWFEGSGTLMERWRFYCEMPEDMQEKKL